MFLFLLHRQRCLQRVLHQQTLLRKLLLNPQVSSLQTVRTIYKNNLFYAHVTWADFSSIMQSFTFRKTRQPVNLQEAQLLLPRARKQQMVNRLLDQGNLISFMKSINRLRCPFIIHQHLLLGLVRTVHQANRPRGHPLNQQRSQLLAMVIPDGKLPTGTL